MTVRTDAEALTLEATVANTGNATVHLHALELPVARVRVPGGGYAARVFKHGWSVSSPAGWIDAAAGDPALELRVPPWLLPRWLRWMIHDPHPSAPTRKGRTTSEGVLAIATRPGGPALVAGALGFRAAFSSFAFDATDEGLAVTQWADGAELLPGGSLAFEPVVFLSGASGDVLLERWAERLGARCGARVPARRRVAWATWYAGAYKGLDERYVHERVAALVAHRVPVDSVIVDDGYQTAHGDWLDPSPRLPSGLGALARHIRDAGYTAGLWIAPFAAAAESRLAKAHPDWLLRDERGRPLATAMILSYGKPTPTYALDTTHPEVLAHVEETAARLVALGFEILKIDFLTGAAAPGARFDRGATRAMAYARGLEALRRGAGDATLVSAIAPLLANTGWVDCQRLSPDTAYGTNRWLTPVQRLVNERASPGIRNNVATTLARAFLGGRLFGADPDAIVFDGIPPALQALVATVNVLGAHLVSLGHDFARSTPDLGEVEALLALGQGRVHVPDGGEPDGLATELRFTAASAAPRTYRLERRSRAVAPQVVLVKESSP
ncbi:MAG: alpha-galactosidase [Deltaproteobacteria bacterium]|nr:alpha-galactosidase [Deltaproteobacteria bacterium]